MGIFNKNQTQGFTKKELAERQFLSSRLTVLLICVFTAINIILALTGSDSYFLFSASIPYYAVILSYIGVAAGELPMGVLIVAIAFAVVVIAAYLLCFIFGKKHFGWLIAALILFSLDTIYFIYIIISAFDASMIIDIVFHLYVIYSLVMSVVNFFRLKNTAEEETAPAPFGDGNQAQNAEVFTEDNFSDGENK